MSQKTQMIGDKVVQLHQPYKAPVGELVGREPELKLVTAAWIAGKNCAPLSPLLLGEPGVGKNHLVYELAQRTQKDLFILQGHEDVTAEDLACAIRYSDDPTRKMDYVVSPLATAMCLGGICFVDEIAKIRPRALALLVSVLDDRRYLDSVLLGERIDAQPGFRFIAATNTADLEGNALPEFIRSRMRPIIRVGYPSRQEIARIISERYPRIGNQEFPLIEQFWVLWDKYGADRPPTPRDVIQLFNLALSLADYEVRLDQKPYPLEDYKGDIPMLKNKYLDQAFAELFGSAETEAK